MLVVKYQLLLPLHRLVTIASFGGFMQAPMKRITFSCLVFRKVATSNLKASSVASSSIFSMSRIFTATSPCHCPLCTASKKLLSYMKAIIDCWLLTRRKSSRTNLVPNFKLFVRNVPFSHGNRRLPRSHPRSTRIIDRGCRVLTIKSVSSSRRPRRS